MRGRTHLFTVGLLLLAACSSDKATDDTSATTAPASTTTSVVATTTTLDGSTTTEAGSTTTAAVTTEPATTVPCVAEGDVARKESDDPLAMSGLVGVDIRTGAHPCYERVVIELSTGPGDFPGWWVEYVDDPVRLGESDEFVDIEGRATLLVRMGMWMPDMEGNGWDGGTQLFPTNVSHILELRQTENWEGVSIWAIGLDGEYPFTVDVYEDPYRLVIDIFTG